MKVSSRAIECLKGAGILRLRKAIHVANRVAALRTTRLVGLSVMCLMMNAGATTYYVSSSSGSDANSGTSASAAWQTLGHVNEMTFSPGDSILFKRGDVWNESLIPPSSGVAGSPIAFDAYGNGAAPNFTGYYAVPSSAWVAVTGNAWKAAVPATFTTVNFCMFGSLWGQKVAAVSSNLVAAGNFYLASGFLYVYSNGNPGLFYNEAIVPMALSNVSIININGKTWVTFQHFLLNWFDQYGVYVQGSSDHLVFANMEADSMIPQGTQPLGFYVNESAPGPGDIKIYNAEAHLNYDGFRFDGTASAIAMVNDKGYANRDGALVDNTGVVTYSYCHFYASSLAVANSTDVEFVSGSGATAGAGNVAVDTPPAVQAWQRYPAEVTLSVDDAGMTPGADTYYANTVLPIADAAGVKVGAAITVGYPLANTLISEFQGWINAGRDVTAHSMSHTYYTNTDALDVQYIGSGTAASLSISGNVLTITVTGASDGVSYNLAQGQPQGTILGLKQALNATGKFTTSYLTPCQGPYGTGCSAYTGAALLTQDLANVTGQDVKTSLYHMLLNVTALTTDEITLSRLWMTTNLTGLPATPVYVYPGGYETPTMQGITAEVPFSGARGALNQDLGVKDTYADGFNVQNVTSFGVNPSWMGLPPSTLNQKIEALIWKEKVWGAPWGIFWHFNASTGAGELTSTEVTNLISDFKNGGATVQTNTGIVSWLTAGIKETGTDGGNYYTIPATNTTLNFNPTKNSPIVDAGQNMGPAYELDINGVNQNSYGSGWEIGAHVFQGYAAYGGGGGGTYSTTGEGSAAQILTVRVNGSGGSVSDTQGGIVNCTNGGGTCSASYPVGTMDTLAASPGSGQLFSGWSNCTGLQGCVLTMASNQTEQAVFTAMNPSLPLVFVQPNEWWCDITAPAVCTPNNHWQYELQLPGTWIGTAPRIPVGCSFNGGAGLPYWTTGASPAAMGAGLQQAVIDMECIRSQNLITGCTMIDFPPGIYVSATGLIWPESAGSAASCFNGIRSTAYASLPLGQIIGTHGNMDNLASAATANVRINNPDLSGQNMYFELGPTNGYGPGSCATSGVICGITTLSVNTIMLANIGKVNTSGSVVTINQDNSGNYEGTFQPGWTPPFAITINGAPYTVSSVTNSHSISLTASAGTQNAVAFSVAPVPSAGTFLVNLANGFVSPTLGGSGSLFLTVDTGSSQEAAITPASATNQSGVYSTWTKTHTAGSCVVYNTSGCGGSGVVNTNGTAVTLVIGTRFNSGMTSITIASTTYAVSAWNSPLSITLSSSAPTQTGVLYTTANLITSGTGAFTLANGTETTISAWNDLQYMGWMVNSSSGGGSAVTFCNPAATGVYECANQALTGASMPDHVVVQDVVGSMAIGVNGDNNLWQVSESGTETTAAQLCSHVHLRQDAAMGDWSSLLGGANSVAEGFYFTCNNASVLDSSVTQALRPGAEGHAVGMGLGSVKNISHNNFEGESSCVFAGGAGAAPSIAGLVVNDDLEMRRNVCTYPYAWLGNGPVISGTTAYWSNTFSEVRKNPEEQKEGQRLLFDGNIFENVDTSGGQFGVNFYLDTKNVSTGFGGQNYQSVLSDATVTNNIMRNSCEGPDTVNSATAAGGGGVAYPLTRLLYNNNLLTAISSSVNVPACVGANDGGFQLTSVSQQWQGTLTVSNGVGTFMGDCSADIGNFTVGSYPPECPGQMASVAATSGTCTSTAGGSVTFSTPAQGGSTGSASYSCASIGATPVVTLVSSGSQYVAGVPTVASATGGCSACTFTPTMVTAAIAPAPGVQVLDLSPGDPFVLTNCTVLTGANMSTTAFLTTFYWATGAATRISVGSAPWEGTPGAGNLTVSFPTASGNGSDTAGFCTLSNVQAGEQNIQWTHNTFISDVGHGINSNNRGSANGPQYAPNFNFLNNIHLNNAGCVNSNNVGQGTVFQEFITDTTTANWSHSVCPSSAGSLYTAYGNNPAYPDAAPVLYFPTEDYCSGSTVSNCVGFAGAMSVSAMPLTLPDYHGYELLCSGSSTSPYCGGGANAASDGTGMGTNISALDAAMTLNQYPGAYPEVPISHSEFFGIHYNHTSTVYPPVAPLTLQTVRLWDTNTGWGDMQVNANCSHAATSGCNFGQLDTWLSKFTNPTPNIILTIAKTPNFISSGCGAGSTQSSCVSPAVTVCSYPNLGADNGSCLPPADLACDGSGTNATWINFVTALWDHIIAAGEAGRITYFEIWNEWNVQGFWDVPYITTTLCPATASAPEKMLIRMEQDARCVIKGTNCNSNGTYPETGLEPAVKILASPLPGPGANNSALTNGGQEYIYLSLGGGSAADALSIHGYLDNKQQTASSCGAAPGNAGCMWPENIVSMMSAFASLQSTFGLSLPVIVSEGSFGAQANTSDCQFEQAFVGRYIAMMLAYGVKEFNWYNLDGGAGGENCGGSSTNPVLLSNFTTGALTTEGAAYETIESWLGGKTFSGACAVTAQPSCSGGATSNLYVCPLSTGEEFVSYDEVADNAACSFTPGSGFSSYLTMSGSTVVTTGTITLDNRPILLEPTP